MLCLVLKNKTQEVIESVGIVLGELSSRGTTMP